MRRLLRAEAGFLSWPNGRLPEQTMGPPSWGPVEKQRRRQQRQQPVTHPHSLNLARRAERKLAVAALLVYFPTVFRPKTTRSPYARAPARRGPPLAFERPHGHIAPPPPPGQRGRRNGSRARGQMSKSEARAAGNFSLRHAAARLSRATAR